MTKKDIIKQINKELRAIRQDVRKTGSSVRSWNYIDPENMDPVEAFNRGFYRAYTSIKNQLK